MHKTYFNWSSGKDSALALYYLLQDQSYGVDQLVTTITKDLDRVTMHGLRKELLIAQANAIGIPLSISELPFDSDMNTYETIISKQINDLKTQGYSHTAFGDIYLEDLRHYRDTLFQKHNVKTIYPLWKKDTKKLLKTFIELGFKSVVIAASANHFDESFVGTLIDKHFIKNLPKDVDPCGENGEFHTFCFDGPIFKHSIDFKIGDTILKTYKTPKTDTDDSASKTGFWFCDLYK